MFHVAKHAMKFIGYSHEYDISNLPIDSKDIYNDLVLSLKGLPVSPN